MDDGQLSFEDVVRDLYDPMRDTCSRCDHSTDVWAEVHGYTGSIMLMPKTQELPVALAEVLRCECRCHDTWKQVYAAIQVERDDDGGFVGQKVPKQVAWRLDGEP